MPVLADMGRGLVLLDDARYHATDVENVVSVYGGIVLARIPEQLLRYADVMQTYEDLASLPKLQEEAWVPIRKCKLVYTLRMLRAAMEDPEDQALIDTLIAERISRAEHALVSLRVVAAAILVDGKIHWSRPPARHPDLLKVIQASGIKEPADGYEQGFLLSDGSYADRSRAWEVAEAAGQLLMRDRQRPGMLFSEDLW